MQKRIIRLIIATYAVFFAVQVTAAEDGHNPLEKGLGVDVDVTTGSHWMIDDGVLIPERGKERTYVVTKSTFGDVEITLEVNPESSTNSGVFVRCSDPAEITPESCYEFNIWDANPNEESRTGAIVRYSPPTVAVETENRWNTMRVRLEGARLQVWVNDTMTNDIEDDKLTEGFIAFQYGGADGMVRFRNIRIRELS